MAPKRRLKTLLSRCAESGVSPRSWCVARKPKMATPIPLVPRTPLYQSAGAVTAVQRLLSHAWRPWSRSMPRSFPSRRRYEGSVARLTRLVRRFAKRTDDVPASAWPGHDFRLIEVAFTTWKMFGHIRYQGLSCEERGLDPSWSKLKQW